MQDKEKFSYGNDKTDKETQSPMLKIFKDMMQRENARDPEKASLLQDEREDRKMKKYSASKLRSDHKAHEAKLADRRKRNAQAVENLEAKERQKKDRHSRKHEQDYNVYQTQNTLEEPIGDKKDSTWWFWFLSSLIYTKATKTLAEEKKNTDDDTKSCVSCALKKILSSQYGIICCLTTILVISFIIALCCFMKTYPEPSIPEPARMPEIKQKVEKEKDNESDSESLKKKLDVLNDKRQKKYLSKETSYYGRGFGGDHVGYKDTFSDERKEWDDNSVAKLLSEGYGLSNSEFADSSLSDMSNLDGGSARKPHGTANIQVEKEKLNEQGGNENLRDFFKKLIKTDAQIRKLKNVVDGNDAKLLSNRNKRSLNVFHKFMQEIEDDSEINSHNKENTTPSKYRDFKHFNVFYPPFTAFKYLPPHGKRKKRHQRSEETNPPAGIVIEKNKLLVQYMKPGKKIPKCSHTPKDSNSPEKQFVHPFYKNSQKLDDILDQFLTKNLPEILLNPFDADFLFNKEKCQCKHKQNEKQDPQEIFRNININKDTNADKDSFKELQVLNKDNKVMSSTDVDTDLITDRFTIPISDLPKSTETGLDVTVGISTVMGNDPTRRTTIENDMLNRVPNIRKLMQADEEYEDSFGYEDVMEVLNDDKDDSDDAEKEGDNIAKRSVDEVPIEIENNEINKATVHPPGVHNPNWKGPMPLYPDEGHTMMKEPQDVNSVIQELPVNTKDSVPESDDFERQIADIELIEDYLNGKYDKLNKIAQAYSDYGVLDGKKDAIRIDKNQVVDESKHSDPGRVKLAAKKNSFLKNIVAGRWKKGMEEKWDPEGLKFELKPYKSTYTPHALNIEDDILRHLKKHVKIMRPASLNYVKSNFMPTHSAIGDKTSDLNLMFSSATKTNPKFPYDTNGEVKVENDRSEYATIRKRSLLAFDDDFDAKFVAINDPISTTKIKSNDHSEKSVKNHMNNHTSENSSLIFNNKTTFNHLTDDKLNLSFTVDIKNKIAYSEIKNVTEIEHISNVTKNINDTTRSTTNIGTTDDFIMMLSNWFSLLAHMAFPDNVISNNTTENLRASNTTKINVYSSNSTEFSPSTIFPTVTNIESMYSKNVNDTDLNYQMYDSEAMVENIGHRSRVLFSIGGNKVPKAISGEDKHNVKDKLKFGNVTKDSTVTIAPKTPSTIKQLVNNENNNETTTPNQNVTEQNRTIVKRSAPMENTNLILWNDIYDDEYGVNTDSIEDLSNKRDENYAKDGDNMPWYRNKFRKFMNFVRQDGKSVTSDNGSVRTGRGVYTFKRRKRKSNNPEGVTGNEQDSADTKSSFAALTHNMKQICKEAAQAVHQTKNLKVREDVSSSKEGEITSSLMQQLVRLMTDLVDFQVQQKTCLKLPSDLQNYLNWLTAPATPDKKPNWKDHLQQMESKVLSELPKLRNDALPEHSMDATKTGDYEYLNVDSRTQCLGTIQAVEDLIQQYDDLTAEDKSKMTGVKEYLENQLRYLNKQLAAYDDDGSGARYPYNKLQIRKRRDIRNLRNKLKKRIHRRMNEILQEKHKRQRRRANRFMKSFGRKHTRSTVSSFDEAQIVTDQLNMMNVVKRNEKIEEINSNGNILNEKVEFNRYSNRLTSSTSGNYNFEPLITDMKVMKRDENIEFNNAENIENNKKGNDIALIGNKEILQTYDDIKTQDHSSTVYEGTIKTEYPEGSLNHKRNLIDVYYKAIADAKKGTTVKSRYRKDTINGRFY